MKSLAKAEALIRGLRDDLKPRIEANAGSAGRLDTVREARDSEGNPMLVLSDGGNEAAGQPVLAIRISQEDAVSKDVFGNDNLAYAPHKLELAYELDGAAPEVAALDLVLAMWEIAPRGVKVQVKQIADGTAVTAANIDAAAVAEEIDWLRWPSKGV
jgi:hypothetical protein